ncbi:hypothetical protein DCAR_0104734 [Daucus carota subsp. sativus]|uniref:Uncharacterized protein n=1 Tax=Daucus carota subsp. sativus TaxID=79200 RepID=A0A166J2N9_DAUCS|nr:hypothetical protein DCAR_0104734 [Daucus carota subsp. sativus]
MILFAISALHTEAAVSRIPAAIYATENGGAHTDFVIGCNNCPSGNCCFCSAYRGVLVCNSCC